MKTGTRAFLLLAVLSLAMVAASGVPLASPGETIAKGSKVILNASTSFDPEGRELTFQWIVDGEEMELETATGELILSPGEHTVELIVSDGFHNVTTLPIDFSVVESPASQDWVVIPLLLAIAITIAVISTWLVLTKRKRESL